jgi:AbrB family looped-hinge helix DNA binding protein
VRHGLAPVDLYCVLWDNASGKIEVGMAKVDEKGRVLIPLQDRMKAGLRPGVELEVTQNKDGILLRPLVPKPVRVRSGRKWGRETFPDAGEATFGG